MASPIRAFPALLLLAVPLSAQAQGIEADGQVELEYFQGNDTSNVLLSGDVMLRYRGGMVGGEIGVDGDVVLDSDDRYKSAYAAALIGTPFGEFAVGAPQPVSDMLIDVPAFNGMTSLDAGGLLPGQPVSLDQPSAVGVLAKANDRQSYGLRYSASAGAVRYGASLHRFVGTGDTVVQAAGEFTMGQTQIEGMVETQDFEGGLSALVGVAHDNGQIGVSAYVSRQTITDEGTTLQLNGDYHFSENLTVGGSVAHKDFNSDEWLYGVTAGWGLGNGAYVSGGIANGNDAGLLMDASVGYKF